LPLAQRPRLVNGTDYTVAGGSGVHRHGHGNDCARSRRCSWIIRRTTTETQETDYVENDPFPAESHEGCAGSPYAGRTRAASAAAAAAAADDIIFNDVVYITNAASPYTLLTTQTGVLLAIDTSGGAVTVNLPSIASAGDGWRISAKKTTGDANFVTFARNGTDTIDGNTSDTITTVGQSKTYVADTDGTPDDWTSVNFGSTLGRTWTDFTYTASGGETSVTGADDDGVVLAYQAGQVKVYLEGLLLDDSDYTATTGTSITGLAALVAGQTLYIETWDNVMSLGTMAAQDANAVAITGGTLASITSINAVTPATAQYTTALDTKLGGIEALADVTDATNVTAAGALMDSELTSIASVKALNQGVATTDTPTFAGIITSGNVDGRDVSVDGTKLDGIEAAADVTDATNVTAAGALMDSELTDIAAVKALDQGVATTDSPTFVNVTATDLDGILGSNTPAAATVTTMTASDDVNLANTKSITFKNAASTVRDIVTLFSDNHLYIDNQDGDIILRNGTPSLTLAASGAATFAGTLSAQATDVTTLTASSEVFANSATNTGADGLVGFHTQDATAPGITMHNTGASGIHWGMYADASGNLQLRNNDTDTNVVTVGSSGTLSAGATDVTTLTASGNAAINTTLPTLNTIDGGLVVGSEGSIMCFAGESNIGNNFYFNSGWKYRATGDTSRISYGSGNPFIFQYAPSGAADSAITFQTAGTINSSGNWDFGAKTLTTTGTLSAGATTLSGTLIQASSSTSKTTNSFKNTETANVAAHSAVEIVSGGPSGGDPQLTFTIPSIGNWSIGMDNSNSDLFTIGNSNSLGTNTALTINSSLNATFAGTLSAGATTVTTGASGATADAVADEGVFEGSGNSGISILTPSANYGSLHFRNPTDGLGALINHISGTGMTIATAVVGQTMVLRADNGVDNLTLSGASGSETAIFAGTADITNGVYIGGSAAANLLDDYEEGTWTPAISGDGTAGTYTNGTTQATYTKIGRMVTVNFGIGSFSTATGGTGNLRITGLPFTKTAGQSPTGSVWFSSVNTGASVISLALVFSTAAGASATLNVNEVVDNAVVQLTPISGVGVSSQIHGSITYFV
jgi:hypothetical protein